MKRYKKQLHRRKIKTRKLFPTNNQLLEKIDEATRPITKKLPDNWGDILKTHCELPPKELQLSIEKKWKTPTECSKGDNKVNNNSPTDCSEGDLKVNSNSPSNQTEGAHYRSIETNLPPQREQVGVSSRQNNNSSSSMD